MTKKLFLITFILISVKLFAQSSILSNFRVEDSEKNRVYFDSSDPINGSNAIGFTISGKTISSVTIISDQKSGHYFTVSSAFTFWDNNTIRYSGNSNIGVLPFDMQYIVNNIREPNASTLRYVSVSGSGNQDGTSEDNSWTLSQANSNAKAGMTIYVKAGTYTTSLRFGSSGQITNPIKFIGYQNTPGDNPNLNWSYPNNTNPNASIMPLLSGGSGTAISAGKNYTIFKNFQVSGYRIGVGGGRVDSVVLDNIICLNQSERAIYYITDNHKRLRVTNSVFYNSGGTSLMRLYGDFGLIENCKVQSHDRGSDYYISLRGKNNIVRNSYIERRFGHQGHGMTLKSGIDGTGTGIPTEWNLMENLEIVGVNLSIEARHFEVANNVYRNFKVYDNGLMAPSNGIYGIAILNGSHDNIFDNISVKATIAAVQVQASTEDTNRAPTAGYNNVFKNCTFEGDKAINVNKSTKGIFIYRNTGAHGREFYDNSFINCNFYNLDFLIAEGALPSRDNHMINSNIINCGKNDISSFDFTNSNFFQNGFTTPSGTNLVSHDPQFVNPSSGDFHLLPSSPILDSGIDNDNVNFDADGIRRVRGKYSIGPYDDQILKVGSVGPDASICEGESLVLMASGGTSYTWSTGETASSITVNPISTTTYDVTISDGQNSDTHEVTVTVNAAPTVSAGSDVTICSGDSITLTATGEDNFEWSTGETTASITVSPNSTTTYSVTASGSCSTSVSDDVIVTVNLGVTLNAGPNVSICSGESVTLTATGNSNFEWSTGETTASITVNPSASTIYTVTSNIGDCSKTDDVLVTVDTASTVNAGSDVSICSGEEVILTATGNGDFLWSTGETTAIITVSPFETTTYTITASGNSCSADVTDEVTVTVNPEIILNAGSDVSICSGEGVTLTATGNSNFEWSTGETTASITVNPLVNTLYTVTSNIGDCSKTDGVLVRVNTPPSVNASSDVSICSGEDVILTANGVGNFLWSTGETTSSIIVSPSTTTTYTVTASSNSCSDGVTDDVIVTVNPGVTLNAGPNVSICSGESVTLTATGNSNFEWSTGETTASITVNPSASTTYTVTSNIGDCLKTDDVLVTVNMPPAVNAGSDVTICQGDTITLTANGAGNFLWSTGETTPSITVRPSATTAYTVTASSSCSTNVTDDVIVTVNPGITLNAGLDVSICSEESITLTATGNGNFQWSTGETTASITVSPSTNTTYTVTSNIGDCSKTDDVLVTVNTAPTVNAGSDVSICSGENVTLTATGNGNFLWSTGETSATIIVSPSITEVYTVTTSSAGCVSTATDNVTVTVHEMPTVDASGDIIIEEGTVQTLTAIGSGTFKWSTGEVGPSIKVSPLSTTTYTVTADTGNGCLDQDKVIVTVVEQPENNAALVVSVGQNVSICQGRTVVLEALEGDSYLWSTGETERTITVEPIETVIYSVKVTTGSESTTDHVTVFIGEDCINSLEKEMKVYPNPTQGLLNVELKGYDDKLLNISVFSLNGTMVYSKDIDNNSQVIALKKEINLSKFSKGVYFVRLSNNDKIETKKVLVM